MYDIQRAEKRGYKNCVRISVAIEMICGIFVIDMLQYRETTVRKI